MAYRATALLTAGLLIASMLTATAAGGVAAAGFLVLLALLTAGRAHVLAP